MQKIIGKMARLYPLLIGMGFVIVVASVAVGYINSQTAAAYYAAPKAVREIELLAQRAFIESTGMWLPYFKFLGIGLILGGIVMALRVIIDNLKQAGLEVLQNIEPDRRPAMPEAPWYGKLMPIVMLLGEAIFVLAFVVGLNLAGIARQVFANPIATIDAAGSGSALLAQVQTIHAVNAWLVPLKFFGVATEFLAIVMGLMTIIFLLEAQTPLIDKGIQVGKNELDAMVAEVQSDGSVQV